MVRRAAGSNGWRLSAVWLWACVGCGAGAGGGGGLDAGVTADVLDQPDGFPTDLIDPRTRMGVIVSSVTTGDWEFLRQRPTLAAQKLAMMAVDPFTFYRGSLALFLDDWRDPTTGLQATAFPAGGAIAFGLGDAHPENFGTMRTAAGVFRLEPNDFDTADLLPYLWDVRRFAVGMCLAARGSNVADPAARLLTASGVPAIVRAAVASYGSTITGLAAGASRPTIESGRGNAVLEDLFTRSMQDWESHAELDELSDTDEDGIRALVRGTPDPAAPAVTTRELPARARLSIPATLAAYRSGLPDPPPTNRLLVPLDAVQQFGVGVGSFPRVRALVLLRGATTARGDDLLLEVKELPPQGRQPLPRASTFATPQARLLAALAAGWTERGADPFWSAGTWIGLPVQLRTEAEGFKTVRVARLEGAQGTVEALTGLGVELARLIARMHAAAIPGGGSPAGQIAGAIATDPAGFADEQTSVAVRYCDQVISDWPLFQQALALAGPTLGVTAAPAAPAGATSPSSSSSELQVLYDPDADPQAAGIDPVIGPVIINEVSAIGDEFVELVNVSSAPQSIAGWTVVDSDDDGGPRFAGPRFGAGAALGRGARVVVFGGYAVPTAGPRNSCPAGVPPCYEAAWDISASRGETIYLLSPDDVILDQRRHLVDPAGVVQSWSRLPDSSGAFAPAIPTAGRANAAAPP